MQKGATPYRTVQARKEPGERNVGREAGADVHNCNDLGLLPWGLRVALGD